MIAAHLLQDAISKRNCLCKLLCGFLSFNWKVYVIFRHLAVCKTSGLDGYVVIQYSTLTLSTKQSLYSSYFQKGSI